jgi:hypothetical protein
MGSGAHHTAGSTAPAANVRYFAVDDQGTGLRATWRHERGFVNLSLWRGDTCVETFRLAPDDAASAPPTRRPLVERLKRLGR